MIAMHPSFPQPLALLFHDPHLTPELRNLGSSGFFISNVQYRIDQGYQRNDIHQANETHK